MQTVYLRWLYTVSQKESSFMLKKPQENMITEKYFCFMYGCLCKL